MEGLGGRDASGGGSERQIGGVGAERPSAVIGVGAGEIEGDVDVEKLVLDRLERSDRRAEGVALLRVVLGHLQTSIGATHLLEREQNGGTVEHALHRAPAAG